jgi:hypothetical protein
MLFSSALIILNKRLYQMGFPHPCFVTGMGQVSESVSRGPLEGMRYVVQPQFSLPGWHEARNMTVSPDRELRRLC